MSRSLPMLSASAPKKRKPYPMQSPLPLLRERTKRPFERRTREGGLPGRADRPAPVSHRRLPLAGRGVGGGGGLPGGRDRRARDRDSLLRPARRRAHDSGHLDARPREWRRPRLLPGSSLRFLGTGTRGFPPLLQHYLRAWGRGVSAGGRGGWGLGALDPRPPRR